MFAGLSAFPLTPVTATGIDETGFSRLLQRIVAAQADSVGILGSTGSYAYLTREQRRHVTQLAREQLGDMPMMVCIGAFSTEAVLHLAEDAQRAGADALLLPALSYQPLHDEEVFGLFAAVSERVSLPICIYDNPGTSHFTFTDTLHGRIAALPGVQSVKIPGVPAQPEAARDRVRHLRQLLPDGVTIGVSGDTFAGPGLNAGCDAWYSVCGGLFPHTAKAITQAAACGDAARVTALSERLNPLWDLFRQHGGSIRVMAAAAGILGLTQPDCLPRPLRPLSAADVADIARVLTELDLTN